ncbi:MAG: hypothetical protein JWO58_2249 [Chitinophagaceae bacterium]|nr:hypothetical protein [Chitinophagaceae bacterium]
MKKNELPQDPSVLDKFTKDLCYVVDESGNYTTGLSRGWEVKAAALDLAWDDIKERTEDARQRALKGDVSPLLFFMELKLMDLDTLAGYSGFWKWQIKRHMKPAVFNRLSEKKLKRYADIFEVSVSDFKNVKANED